MGALGLALLRRSVQAVGVAVIVSLLCFLLVRLLPGDQAMRIAERRYGEDRVTSAAARAVQGELGLDRPVWEQLGRWIGQTLRGDLGVSLISGERVSSEIGTLLGATSILAFGALAFALVLGPLFGLVAGLAPGGLLDRAGMIGAAGFRAVPTFVLGVVLMMIFGVLLRWLPVAGFGSLANLVLPAATLGLGLAATSARVARDATFAASRAPFFAFARLRGLTRAQAIWRHVPRNAAVPVVAYLSVNLALLVEGIVVVEVLFGWPGLGHELTHAIIARDVPMLQGAALALGLVFVALNAATDLALLAIDPRRR